MEKVSLSARPRRIIPSAAKDVKFSSASVRRRPAPAAEANTRSKLRSAKRQGSGTKSQPHASDVDVEENDIKFINIETRSDAAQSNKSTRPVRTMEAGEILERCQETDYRNVYDIDLRGSQLSQVPNLEKFSKARVIDLSSNSIQAISRLECCAELRELKMYDNQLTAIEKLDALSDLSHLQFQHNKIRQVGRGLVSCRKLLTLRLDWNNLNKLESKEMAAMSKLTSLDLSNNKLENVNALNCLPNLLELYVSNNRLQTLDLSRCKKIEELDLSGNRFTDLNCFISHSSSLKTLNVCRNELSKLELSAPLHKLEELYISHNAIKRLNGIPSKLPVLQVLDLSHNHIHNDKELLYLQHCTSLREVDLTNNPFDLDELGQVSTNPAEIIPSLQILDGLAIKKQSNEHKVPLMRPMSASHVISSRQVQSQLDSLDTEMRNLQSSLEEKFRDFRRSIDQLPSRPTSAVSDPDRPATRGSRRSRIMDARAFAVNRYSEN